VNKSRSSQLKRQRERAQAERRQEKVRKRLENRARRDATPRQPGEEDPDIAGIRPGPQPSPYGDEPVGDETNENE
jgi:hypothetical protein